MKKNALPIVMILLSTFIQCTRNVSVINLTDYYRQYDIDGCFVLYDLNNDCYTLYNEKHCKTGFLPASTFKILNSLIGLESGVIDDENFLIEWDGTEWDYPIWNQDHTLSSAIQYSVVWYYQELARRVDEEAMLKYLQLADYGNRDISEGVDVFWLEGDFKITPIQQVQFLVKLYKDQLPFSTNNMDIVKQITVTDQSDDYVIHSKTGSIMRQPPYGGWWVGYVETSDNVYFFANHFTTCIGPKKSSKN